MYQGPSGSPWPTLGELIAQNRRVVVFGEAPSSCCSAVPRRCDAERGRLPNLVAVDFYGRGDLFDVVRTLNGLK